jgi:hypothetical protein
MARTFFRARSLFVLSIALSLAAGWLFANGDWRREGFTSPADQVYRSAKKVISEHYRLESSDEQGRTLRFHIGTTAWSWGYNVNLTVESKGPDISEAWVAIEKSGGPTFSWGSGKKESGKIWRWIHDDLYTKTRSPDQATTEHK